MSPLLEVDGCLVEHGDLPVDDDGGRPVGGRVPAAAQLGAVDSRGVSVLRCWSRIGGATWSFLVLRWLPKGETPDFRADPFSVVYTGLRDS